MRCLRPPDQPNPHLFSCRVDEESRHLPGTPSRSFATSPAQPGLYVEAAALVHHHTQELSFGIEPINVSSTWQNMWIEVEKLAPIHALILDTPHIEPHRSMVLLNLKAMGLPQTTHMTHMTRLESASLPLHPCLSNHRKRVSSAE